MSRDWKTQFTTWSKPPSETEEAKAAQAAKMIREAIAEHHPLQSKRTSVYATGSYRNNTNIRLESDIDIAVILHDCFFAEYPTAKPPSREDLGHSGGVLYGLSEFRVDVGNALIQKFGRNGVTPGSKAFDVHENTVRLDADVAVFLEHHKYTGARNIDGSWPYLEGVEMRGVGNTRIINWHNEHYNNGVAKNNRTSRRFKRVTRILKRLRDDMKITGNAEAKAQASKVPSFLLECIAYNASDECYQQDDLYQNVRTVIAEIWNKTKPETDDLVLVEVSGLKWLFGASQPWNKRVAHEFLLAAWKHVGFGQ
jgi:uncharacterized protein (DUF4415 family)